VLRSYINCEIAKDKPANLDKDADNDLLIYNICKRIDWQIKETKSQTSIQKLKQEKKEPETGIGHVMISYNRDSRALCLKVKTALEESGYKVWMDTVNMHGDSLEAMAQAVENASVILMCVTEKYRASANCQGEAQYSFRCGKNIVPCIMQQGYESVGGWLGFIMGGKIFVHFMKYDFDECMRRLRSEIDVYYKVAVSNKTLTQQMSSAKDTKPKEKRYSEVLKWTESQVREWFHTNEINMAIYEELKPCTGEMLEHM